MPRLYHMHRLDPLSLITLVEFVTLLRAHSYSGQMIDKFSTPATVLVDILKDMKYDVKQLFK